MKTRLIAAVCFAALAACASTSIAQVGRTAASGQMGAPGSSAIKVRVVDDKGQEVRQDSLPKDAQANIERVRKAAESLHPPTGADAQKFKVTINCTWAPLRCTIDVSF